MALSSLLCRLALKGGGKAYGKALCWPRLRSSLFLEVQSLLVFLNVSFQKALQWGLDKIADFYLCFYCYKRFY